jgi:hypothetical protein
MTGALEEPHYRRLSVDAARERDEQISILNRKKEKNQTS